MSDTKDDKTKSSGLLPTPNVPALVRASVVAAGLLLATPGCGDDAPEPPMPPTPMPPMPGPDADIDDGALPPMPAPIDADLPDGDIPPMPPPTDADVPDGPVPPMPPPMDPPPPMPDS